MVKVQQARYGRGILADPPILDGLYDSLPVGAFPCTVRASFLLVLQFDRQESESTHNVRMELKDYFGNTVSVLRDNDPVVIPPRTDTQPTAVQMFDVPLDSVLFPHGGLYTTRVSVNEQPVLELPIPVHLRRRAV